MGIYKRKILARPKKIKKPSESVPKVNKTDEPTAGSLLNLSRRIGIRTPRRAPINILQIIAMAITRAILNEPETIQAKLAAIKLPVKPTRSVTVASRRKR